MTVQVPLLRGLLERRSGLDLGRGGMEANLVSFVEQRLAATNQSFEGYVEQLEIAGSEELRLLVETMTVVYTWFFRDPGQFAVISQLIREFPLERPMGIWIAGCATGEETYSVALVASELTRRVHILGTDLNSNALRHAKAGIYSSTSLSAVDAAMRARYLGRVTDEYVVPASVKQCVTFQSNNLVEAPPRAPHGEGWDLVVCRNVLIYFGREQARRTLDSLASTLAPGGALVLGASEAILDRPKSLRPIGIAGRSILIRPRSGDSQPCDTRSSGVNRVETPVTLERKVFPSVCNIARNPATALGDPATRESSSSWLLGGPELPAVRPDRRKPTEIRHIASVPMALDRGHNALESGDIPNARESYLRAIELDPTCAEALMFAGIAHYLDGALTEALHHLRGALCLDASLWAACFYLALCYENMGYAEDAARSYSQVIRLANDSSRPDDEHPFLREWRPDLLAVAHKRAHPGKAERGSSAKIRIRTQVGSR